MHRRRLLCTIGVCLWLTAVDGHQAPPSAPLTGEQKAHLKDERFQIVTSLRGLPLGVREALQTLFGGYTLDIAEPGGEFHAGAVSAGSAVPVRRLVAAGCSYDHCVVYYRRGGVADAWRAALFHWTPEATRFESGGAAPGGLATVDEVRRAMLSGAVKSTNDPW